MMITDEMEEFLRRPQQIHITVLEVPVSYQAVLNTVPGLHARPPVLPRPNDPAFAIPPPPANGYDFIFHIGVAGRGPLRIERIGHKNGYRMKDADGEYAPIVHLPKDPIRDSADAELERMERMLVGASLPGPSGPEGPGPAEVMEIPPVPNRGFGKGYENFPDELSTEIDVPKLIVHLKENGIDVRVPAVFSRVPWRTADGPAAGIFIHGRGPLPVRLHVLLLARGGAPEHHPAGEVQGAQHTSEEHPCAVHALSPGRPAAQHGAGHGRDPKDYPVGVRQVKPALNDPHPIPAPLSTSLYHFARLVAVYD